MSINEVIANLKVGKADYDPEERRSIPGNKSLARDTAFQLLYLTLHTHFGDESKDSMNLFNAVMFVVSHPGTFKYRTKRVTRAVVVQTGKWRQRPAFGVPLPCLSCLAVTVLALVVLVIVTFLLLRLPAQCSLVYFHFLQCARASYDLAGIIFEPVIPDLLVWIFSGTKTWGRSRRLDRDQWHTATLAPSHGVRQVSTLWYHVPLAPPTNDQESCFVAARTCHSQDMREACMGRPICVRRGGQNRQRRHRTLRE